MLKRPQLLVWGASGHALVVVDIIRLRQEYDIVGFLDDVTPSASSDFCGFPVFRSTDIIPVLIRNGLGHVIFAFGNCSARLRLGETARVHGLTLASAVHPSAVIASDAEIGAGTVIAAGAIINPGSRIGENVIINTRASVDHDCVIAAGAHICPGVTLGGYVTVGRASWIGIGATVKDHVNVGSGSVVGAGAVVLSDVPDRVTVYGVPAKVMKGL